MANNNMIGLTHPNLPRPIARGPINLGGMQSPGHNSRNPFGKGIDYAANPNAMARRLPSVTPMGPLSMGGGQSPLHFARNPFGKGVQYGGYGQRPAAPKQFKPFKPFKPSNPFLRGIGGGFEPPTPPTPHIKSSIPFNQMQSQFLPDSVVQTDMAQQAAKALAGANPQPMFEQYAANQNNMASASSGQYLPMITAQMAEPMQQQAFQWGTTPLQAAMQQHQFATQGMQAQNDEVLQLANLANARYGDQLGNWQNNLQQRLAQLAYFR